MDSADFWQQARAPFALHTAATALHQHQHQHTQQHPQPLSSQQEQHANPTNNNNHLPLNSKLEPNQVQQQEHPQHQQTHQQLQQQQPQQSIETQLLQQHVEQCYSHESFEGQQSVATAPTSTQLSNHHLLFNAAAAAAAAAHLKSTALNNHAQNNITSSNANSSDQLDNPLPLPIPPLSNHNLNSSGHLAVKTKQEHDQQQPQPSEDPRPQPSDQTYSSNFYAGPSEQRSQLHQQHQQQPHQPRSPLLTKTISQGQQSPQHSITPSGGSSTPDIKYNNEKLANEIQLQLSRSSSAAAISERTLEECWSTLQRVSWHLFRCLFMHKSAMQQIQQQIPRVGLGAHGVPGTASMGSGTTPGAETKPHQCQQCMKSFSSNHQLVQHIRVHTGEKPYKCSYCDRRFKQLSHVQQHTRLHTVFGQIKTTVSP
nr:GATA zinc finger domain-containing protein 10 isoform X9 [Drosophila virilis]